jgi:hypothetical protein
MSPERGSHGSQSVNRRGYRGVDGGCVARFPRASIYVSNSRAPSFRSARSANPESRDSGFSPAGCPGMTASFSGAARHSRAADRLRVIASSPPSQWRAQGMPGASAAPAALRATKESTQASHRRSAEHVRHSPRGWFYGLWRALPGEPGFLSPSPRNAKHCRELTPASGRQDHALSPSAPRAFVSRAHHVHRIFRPTFGDDRETPLLGRAEDARRSARDLPVVTSGPPATD